VELERVAAVLRPRGAWEAADLGVALFQRWSKPVFAAWSVTALPVLLAVTAYARDSFWLACFLIWVLAPLLERVPLFVLSRALFGATPAVLDVLRELPRLWGRGFLVALTFHRLHPFRSLVQPVALLEGLRGRARMRREAVLFREHGPLAFGVALLCAIFTLVLALGAFVTLVSVVPGELLPDLRPLEDGDLGGVEWGWLGWAMRGAVVAAYSVVGPLHASIGFALYVDRRSHLEGWDVELAFRRLAARVERVARAAAVRGAAALAALLLAVGALAPGAVAQDGAPQDELWSNASTAEEVEAQEPESAAPSEAAEPLAADDPARVIGEVLATEEFSRVRRVAGWRLRGRSSSGSSSFPLDLVRWIAPLLEIVAWALIVALFVFLAVLVGRKAGWIRGMKRTPPPAPPPTELFGLDLRPQSLPRDVAGAAWELWRAGRAVEALGLLYRGAIARLVERDGLALERSDTESDCLRRARKLTDADRYGFFADVTRTWLACAYASIPPSEATVERLCREWRARFERSAA
jgi:hypothetical protein